ALVGGAGYLMVAAVMDDLRDRKFQESRKLADEASERALQLARDPAQRIPPEGAAYLLARDPLFHGRRVVLEPKCLSCHHYGGLGQVTREPDGRAVSSPQTAADLKDFGTTAWVRGLLENPSSPTYFGKVPQCQGMATWKKSSKLKADELDAV